jgi:Amt family ammonium transporter
MDTGNTAWVLICTALVLLMTPGLAFFYGGLVREKNVVNTMKMSFVALGMVSIVWALLGYSLAFAPGTPWIGGLAYLGLSGVGGEPGALGGDIPHAAFMLFQMMFAVITPALISGAVVGRIRFKPYAAFIVLWSVFVYSPIAHWVWGTGGWLANLGALDFAGGSVVHISAGVSALVAALILGPRLNASAGNTEERPHNVPFVVLGASLLWFGWFGFNAGSALAADGLAALAMLTTMLSAAAAVVAWMITHWALDKKPTAVGSSIAAVVGLVAITPAAGFVTPLAAIVIGAVATLVSYAALSIISRSRIDDTLDVFACHGVGGVVGALLTGVFATTSVNAGGANGLLYGNPQLLGVQAISVLATALYAAAGTAVVLLALKRVTSLRTSQHDEERGVDLSEHDENAYDLESPTYIVRSRRNDPVDVRKVA